MEWIFTGEMSFENSRLMGANYQESRGLKGNPKKRCRIALGKPKVMYGVPRTDKKFERMCRESLMKAALKKHNADYFESEEEYCEINESCAIKIA